MTYDFAHYLHLHRVRTLLQILTPYLEAGMPLNPATCLQQFRDCPGSAYLACDERPDAGGCLPLAIDDAAFERVSDQQLIRISRDAVRCIQLHYGDRVRLLAESMETKRFN